MATPNKLLSVSSLTNKYYALRHGQSMANVAKIISSDPKVSTVEHGLSDLGKKQARNAARLFVPSKERVVVVSSDFKRARETADIFADFFGIEVRSDIRLRERYFGDYNGRSDDNYITVWKMDATNPNQSQQNVESVNSVVARTTQLILDTEESVKGCDVVLVAHGDVLQILQTAFAKMDGRFHRSFEHLDTATIRELVLLNVKL